LPRRQGPPGRRGGGRCNPDSFGQGVWVGRGEGKGGAGGLGWGRRAGAARWRGGRAAAARSAGLGAAPRCTAGPRAGPRRRCTLPVDRSGRQPCRSRTQRPGTRSRWRKPAPPSACASRQRTASWWWRWRSDRSGRTTTTAVSSLAQVRRWRQGPAVRGAHAARGDAARAPCGVVRGAPRGVPRGAPRGHGMPGPRGAPHGAPERPQGALPPRHAGRSWRRPHSCAVPPRARARAQAPTRPTRCGRPRTRA
jgi:hypothetical protein